MPRFDVGSYVQPLSEEQSVAVGSDARQTGGGPRMQVAARDAVTTAGGAPRVRWPA